MTSTTFQLPSELTIYSVTTTREALLAWLEQQDFKPADSVEIDAVHVEEIDGAGIQLLGALTATLKRRGLLWRIQRLNMNLLEVYRVLGCLSWLERTVDTGASK